MEDVYVPYINSPSFSTAVTSLRNHTVSQPRKQIYDLFRK